MSGVIVREHTQIVRDACLWVWRTTILTDAQKKCKPLSGLGRRRFHTLTPSVKSAIFAKKSIKLATFRELKTSLYITSNFPQWFGAAFLNVFILYGYGRR